MWTLAPITAGDFCSWLLANTMIDMQVHIPVDLLWCCSISCPQINATRPRGTRKSNKKWVMVIDISGWRNPMSRDFAWLYINRVINRSITHSKGDSCHIKWQDVEHRPNYGSLLRGCFLGGECMYVRGQSAGEFACGKLSTVHCCRLKTTSWVFSIDTNNKIICHNVTN